MKRKILREPEKAILKMAKRHCHWSDKNISLPIDLATENGKWLFQCYTEVRSCLREVMRNISPVLTDEGIFYAVIEPEHRVEDVVVDLFTQRFPNFVIVVNSRRGSYVGFNDRRIITSRSIPEILKLLQKRLSKSPIFEMAGKNELEAYSDESRDKEEVYVALAMLENDTE